MDYDYLARERALAMAQCDWHAGVISEDRVMTRARQYEAYLKGRPVALDPEPGPPLKGGESA
jgi:hypothetical protein